MLYFKISHLLFSSALLLSTALSVSAFSTQYPVEVPIDDWVPAAEDRLIVDTKSNSGYLLHTTGSYAEFPVVTGQLRNVYYIGRSYYAKTPDIEWEVKSMHKKYPSVTFGPTGRFLRLFDEGTRTAYGIHGHKYAQEMLEQDMRYRSIGCIIVDESILDIIENTYQKNGELLNVKTMQGNPFNQ